jgi:hypothetical protein
LRHAPSTLSPRIAGADGFVTKQEMGETVLLAIRSVLKGEE